MQRLRVRSVGAWLALVAALVLALAPAVSRAMAASDGPALPAMTICTADGVRVVDAAGSPDGGAPAGGASALDACGLCLLQASGPVPPPATPGGLAVLPALRAGLPPLFWRAPRPRFAWSGASPRAPPARG